MKKINEGIFKPYIDAIYPIKEVKNAHEKIENRKQIGKVVLEFNDSNSP